VNGCWLIVLSGLAVVLLLKKSVLKLMDRTVHTQRDATSQYYYLLGNGMVFIHAHREGTWGSGNLVTHLGIYKVPADTAKGGGGFQNIQNTQICCGFFRAGFCSHRRQYYGSLLRGLGLT
jgi:hypothetical protein